jgi:RNA polymerase sigma factor, sigma-70 family
MIKKTFSEIDTLEFYLSRISKLKPLSMEEEAILAKKIRQGDIQAKKKLVKANLRFVVSVARNYENQGMPLSDLINEGNIGLIKATEKFDERKNFKFISYAVWWIRQSMLKALSEQSRIVHIPLHAISTISDIAKVQTMLEQKYQRAATVPEIVLELKDKVSESIIKNVIKVGNRYISLDQPIGEKNDTKLLDMLVDENQNSAEDESLDLMAAKQIKGILNELSENEAIVLRLYFGIGEECNYTLSEIGNKLHLTRERIRQIKEHGLKRLRNLTRAKKLRDLN